jgi:putative resolvase
MENEKTIRKGSKTKSKKEKEFVTVGVAAALTGLEAQTIRKLADNSSFLCYRTPSDQRRINLQSLQDFINSSLLIQKVENYLKKNFLYARVSSKKQMDNLSRQVEYIKRPEYSDYTLITDVSSGTNFKRKGLSTILDACIENSIGNIVIANKDKLCRFGYELIEELVTKAGGRIIVLDQNDNLSDEDEISDDLLSIVQIFLCKKRGNFAKKVVNSPDQIHSETVPKEDNQ